MSIFENIKIAFHDKSDKDLSRAYLLFKTINNRVLSKTLISLLKVAIKLKIPINSIIKETVYKHFCGGTNIQNSQETINKLWESKIGTILDFSAEGNQKEKDFNKAMNETIMSIKKAKNEANIPFAVFKPTGITKFSLLEKISNTSNLSKLEEIEKKSFEHKIVNICKAAHENDVPLFIDAEESWIQDAIDNTVLRMMRKFNNKKAIIFNTIQMYRKDRLNYLNFLMKDAEKHNYFIGLKIVRGAYHEQEIQRSKEKKYPCPVHKEKYNTDKDYNIALKICIEHINKVAICVGTHNEESCELLITLFKNYNICENDKRIYFSQLLGMSDHISYNAANKGFNVAKYVPYGPVKDVIPYLIRRAEENTSISGQIGRELKNIIKEKKRRKSNTTFD